MTRARLIKLTALAGIVALSGCAGSNLGSHSATKSLSAAEMRRVNEVNGRLAARTWDEIHFDFNQAALTPASQQRLDQVAKFIVANPSMKFSVIGHADAVGSNRYNHDLGMRRAYNALGYLIGQGVSFTQLQATVSFGEEDLEIQTDAREVRNRRVVVEVIDFLKVPVKYAQHRGKSYPVWPEEAVNSPENVCGGGGLASLCASASLLNIMNLETNVQVSRDLQIELGLLSNLDLSNPNGTLSTGAVATVGNTVSATLDATGDLGDTVGDTVGDVGDAVGDTVGGVGGAVGGLLGG